MFLVFEGIDGSGKSTQARLLAGRLREDRGKDVLLVREPGGTPLGEKLRGILLEGTETLAPETELFLFMAARSHLCREEIVPALEAGRVVISDRFIWSSAVYQGLAAGCDVRKVLAMGKLASHGAKVTRTFLIDVDPAAGLARVQSPNRMETRGLEFQEKVRAGFLHLAELYPRRVAVIDGSGTIDEVHSRVMAALPARGW